MKYDELTVFVHMVVEQAINEHAEAATLVERMAARILRPVESGDMTVSDARWVFEVAIRKLVMRLSKANGDKLSVNKYLQNIVHLQAYETALVDLDNKFNE